MNNITEIVYEIASNAGWNCNLSRIKLWKKWEDIAGKTIANYAIPLTFQKINNKEVLIVAVSDPIWMHELSMQRLNLLKNINDALGSNGFDDIRFVHKELPPITTHRKKDNKQVESSVRDELQNKAHTLCECIKDQELKSALERFYLAHQFNTYTQARGE